MRFNTKYPFIIAAHKGNCYKFPGNTVLAFDSAAEAGVDMIETDLRLTGDRDLVLIHDHILETTTNGTGLVKDYTVPQLKEFFVGDPSFDCHLITIEEFLERYTKYENLLFDLEIKTSDESDDDIRYILDKVASLCKKYDICKKVIINSFDFRVIKFCKEIYGDLFLLHGFYPYNLMYGMDEDTDPTPYLDYACYWGYAPKDYKFLLDNGIAPCTGSSTPEHGFYELAELGCAMYTENDAPTALKWRQNFIDKNYEL